MLGLGNILTKGGAILGFPNDFSFNFDGSNDYLDCGTSLGNSLGDSYGNDLTISVWIKLDTTGTTRGIFEIGAFGGSHGKINLWYSSDGTIKYRLNSGDWTKSVSFSDTTNWNHLAIVYDASSESDSKLYLNGSSVGSASGTFPSSLDLNGLKTIIGGVVSSSFTFDGLIDEVAIWDTALSASDIAKIASKPVDFSKASTYATDRTSNLKLWRRAGDKAEPESTTAIARQDFYTDFDGSDDCISVSPVPPTTSTGSASFWVKNSADNGEAIFSFGDASTNTFF